MEPEHTSGKRRSIHIEGVSHGEQPFPLASRRGPLVATSGVHGMDPATGELPDSPDDQIRLAFENLASIMRAAGGSMDDVVQVQVTLAAKTDRPLVNVRWLEHFPDPDSRPARNTVERELGGGSRCSLLAVAWIPTFG